MAVRFDDQRWPVLVATFDGEHTQETIEQFTQGMDRYYARQQPFATVYHVKEYKGSDVRLVAPAAKWYAGRRDGVQELEAGLALVIPSETFRFVLSSILVVARLPKHYEVVNRLEDGIAWAERRVRDFRAAPQPNARPDAAGAGPGSARRA